MAHLFNEEPSSLSASFFSAVFARAFYIGLWFMNGDAVTPVASSVDPPHKKAQMWYNQAFNGF